MKPIKHEGELLAYGVSISSSEGDADEVMLLIKASFALAIVDMNKYVVSMSINSETQGITVVLSESLYDLSTIYQFSAITSIQRILKSQFSGKSIVYVNKEGEE